MAEQIQLSWASSPTAFGTLTNLHSLASGNMWNSGVITNTSPVEQLLQISYNLVFNAAGTAGDYLAFWIIGNDDDGTPYWPASISETQGAITSAAAIAEALASIGSPAHVHSWQTSHGTTYRGNFRFAFPTPDWQLLIRIVGEALASSGNVVRYRYATPQVVSV